MPKMVGVGPFQKFYLNDQCRLNPNAFLHFVGVQTLTPPGLLLFREVGKRAIWSDQRLQLLEQLTPTSWNKSVSGPRN
jgi:hypothetical protein